MASLPPEIEERIARGVAAYIRATESAELPGRLRRFKGFTERGVKSQAGALLAALSDAGLRARIVEWLDDKPKRLPAREEQILRLACERPEGWSDRLAGIGEASRKPTSRSTDAALKAELEREREKTRKARQEARAARESVNSLLDVEKTRAKRLAEDLVAAKKRIEALERDLVVARKQVQAIEARLDREVRKARREADKAVADRDSYKEKERAIRKELAAAQRELLRSQKPEAAPRRSSSTPVKPPARRKRLPAPLGRLADDPETLAEWLDTEGVRLVIDGYNVTKAEGGYGDLTLPAQRERLIDSVGRVVRGKRVTGAVIVFDGSDDSAVRPTSGRRSKGKVRIEYSAPDVIADDHIVALVKSLPAYPVVVVTNDRELQNRVARHAATVARSDQLIALFR